MTRALIPLANGVEEMEAVIIVDVLRRAKWDVVSASLAPGPVTGSRAVKLVADRLWSDIEPRLFDVLVLPGGAEGVRNLCAHAGVLGAVRSYASNNKLIGAICAGPLVLQTAGVLETTTATSHPSVRAQLRCRTSNERVVVDGQIVTSQGPGTAIEFAMALIRLKDGMPAAQAVGDGLVLK